MITILRAFIASCFAALALILGPVLLITDGPGAGLSAFVGLLLVGSMIAPTAGKL